MSKAKNGLKRIDVLQAWLDLGDRILVVESGVECPPLDKCMQEVEFFIIDLALRRAGGNLTRAGAELEKSRKSLRQKLKAVNRYPWHPEPIGWSEGEDK